MTLSKERLAATLGDRPFRFYEQVDSTQDLAFEWLRQGAPDGAVIIGDEQVKGRGRHGRVWYTPPGVALALSVIFKPTTHGAAQVTMLGALAMTEVLDGLGAVDVSVKWPNDVRVAGRKVCGILPEAVWEGDTLLGAALGMGINVRVDFYGTELVDTAVSIEPALGRSVDRTALVADLLARVDAWRPYLGTKTLFRAWCARLATLGQQVQVEGIAGIAEDVDETGALLIRDADDVQHRVIAGDVQV